MFRDGRFRIVVFNVENLFVLLDSEPPGDLASLSEEAWRSLSISTTPNKPLRRTLALARAIRELDPDVVMLCEVGGLESLANFNRLFLGGAYRPFLIEGNSDRGIDLGYLAKRSLDASFELVSHKNRPIDFLYPHEKLSKETGYDDRPSGRIDSHRFSRDVLELRVFAGEAPIAGREPAAILMLVHLKSQLDRDRIDPFGRDRRKAELEKLVQIWKEIDFQRGGRTPVLIGGDFNGNATRAGADPEFEALYRESPLLDALEIAGTQEADRYTFMQIQGYGVSRNRQLDYLFVPPSLAPNLIASETFVYRFRDALGAPTPPPRTVAEKQLLPSDHFPVVATFSGLRPSGG